MNLTPQKTALIQARINEGFIINKDTEALLVYNCQPFIMDDSAKILTLDMLVKPIYELNDTHKLQGQPLQLAVEMETGI